MDVIRECCRHAALDRAHRVGPRHVTPVLIDLIHDIHPTVHEPEGGHAGDGVHVHEFMIAGQQENLIGLIKTFEPGAAGTQPQRQKI